MNAFVINSTSFFCRLLPKLVLKVKMNLLQEISVFYKKPLKQLYLSSDVTLCTQTPLFFCEHSLSQSNQFLLHNIYFPFYIFFLYFSDHQSESGLWTESHVDFETFTHSMSILQICCFIFSFRIVYLSFVCCFSQRMSGLICALLNWHLLAWMEFTSRKLSQLHLLFWTSWVTLFLLLLKWLYIGNTLTCSSKRWKYLFG